MKDTCQELIKFLEKKPLGHTLIVGQTGTGKTLALKYILYHIHKLFSYGVIFCPTIDDGLFDYDFIDPEFIHPNWDDNVVRRMIDKQKFLIAKHGRSKCPNAFVLCDDLGGLLRRTNDELMYLEHLYKTARHYKVYIISLLQKYKDVPPGVRDNTDFVYITKIGDDSLINIYKNVVVNKKEIKNKDDFINFVEEKTDNWKTIGIRGCGRIKSDQWYVSIPVPQVCPPFYIKTKVNEEDEKEFRNEQSSDEEFGELKD